MSAMKNLIQQQHERHAQKNQQRHAGVGLTIDLRNQVCCGHI